ncbi:MAG: helix-turn-helix domain-containing protein [Tannerella sp.]|jgi:predicted DNA-binding transcriptional regulator YafY|nr:helix-turn-helix domain-containing protein [Tannerella sp.]
MILLKQIELLQKAHRLISQECTGTPEEFARKLGISQRRLFVIIDEMKDMGAPVEYSRMNRTYYYSKDCEAKLFCSFQCLSEKEKNDTFAGYFLTKNLYCFFCAVEGRNFALPNGEF